MNKPLVPFLTAYDPPGTSEGSLDPLGLYQIADQMALRLVPGVRERMQRIRFLTAMAVGAVVTEGLEANPRQPSVLPFLVWEWLVVQAIVQAGKEDDGVWGVPGKAVVGNALKRLGYVDERSYLKGASVFGFHGTYKRLAVHLGIVDNQLRLRTPYGERLVQAWAHDAEIGTFNPSHSLCRKWNKAVNRSLQTTPVHSIPRWNNADWGELAALFFPHTAKRREKRHIEELLKFPEDKNPGAFNTFWELVGKIDMDTTSERATHQMIKEADPILGTLIDAIFAYESFSRAITDGFDILRAEAGQADAKGYSASSLEKDADFKELAARIPSLCSESYKRLDDANSIWAGLFDSRFSRFAEISSAAQLALALITHHESVQRGKSYEGKRSWFDRLDSERIYMRISYRIDRPSIDPEAYLHNYRLRPLKRFHNDIKNG